LIQEIYWFASPPLLPQGTRLDMEITYDNLPENPRNPNHPPRRVTWGFLTTDEMGEIHLGAVALNGTRGAPMGMDAHDLVQLPRPTTSVLRRTLRLAGALISFSVLVTALLPASDSAVLPDDADSHYRQAEAYAQQGNFESAIRELEAARTLDPSSLQIRRTLGLTLLREGYLSEAVDELRQAVRLDPGNAELRSQLAQASMRASDFVGATREFQEVIKSSPGDLMARNNLGVCYLNAGQWAEAARTYQELVSLDPTIPEAFYNLGVALKHAEQFDDAIAAFQKAIELKPELPEAKTDLGEILWQEGRLDEAAAQLRAACQMRPDFTPAYYALVEVLRQKNDFEGAFAVVQVIPQLDPRNPSAYQELAMVEKQRGNVDGAAAAFHKAEELKRVSRPLQAAQLATATGTELLQKGELPKAIAKFEFALKLDPNLAAAHFELGMASWRQHNRARASAEFEKARTLDPRLKPPRDFVTHD
jgi:Flp pilus assembly protein TadD